MAGGVGVGGEPAIDDASFDTFGVAIEAIAAITG
jgi:hypothetical protein